MFKRLFLYLKNFDWVLFAAVFLLVCFGLAEIYSVALGHNSANFGSAGASLLNFKKQMLFAIVGIMLLFGFSFWDYYNFRNYSNYFYIFGVVLLVLVLVLGSRVRGTTGWFYIGGFGIQPVELIKFIVILFLARYFSDVNVKMHPLKHLLISGSGVAFLAVLVLLQPDFGSAAILFCVWMIMLLFVGFAKKYFVSIILILIVSISFSWLFLFHDYQKQRILTFFQPSYNPLDQGYNVAQAIIAVGAGGLTGRGIGYGSQSQLKFLPESQNDFIFAVIAEELGFLGIFLVIVFFGLFFWRSIIAVKKTNNDFGIFVILGISGLIFVEMFINIGMNIGILPVVGLSLPFVSYGGSGLIINLMMIGVLESIIIRSKINYS